MDQQIRMGKFLNKKLAIYLVANRVIFFVAAYFLTISSPIQKILPFKSFLDFLETFGKRWDGNSYTFIAANGYVTTGVEKFFIVFPPLYPAIIKALTFLHIDSVTSGIIISNLFFIAAMAVFYRLLRLDYNKKFSFFVIVLLSIFPTSFFFSVAYPESLFFFLFVLTFYLARKKKYFLSAFAGGLAVITRPFGIIILPALLLQIFIQKDLTLKRILVTSVIFGLPSAVYLFINFSLFGDPFAFAHLLKENWQKSFAYPWEGIIASWKRGLFTEELSSYKFFVGFGEAIASTLACVFIPLGVKHWGLKSPYLLYLLLATIFFTSTGFILSAPRYLLSIPPFFIILAKALGPNKFIKSAWIALSITLLFYISYEFAWGHWTF